jgi:hypothetical protein
MADVKISQLPAATTPLAGTEEVPLVQSGTTKKVSVADLRGAVSVTGVTGVAPVVSSGGATPAISMAAATTSADGYLTSTDWNTFNSKQPAGSYLTSGGALGTPSSGTATNLTGLPLTTGVTGLLPVANGGTGTATPSLVAGTNVTITGTWPNQTINSSGGGGGGMVYPGAGIPLSTGIAWGTSYSTTGTGDVVLSTSPTLVTPVLGTPTSATLTNATGLPLTTGVTGTLPIANGGTGTTSTTFANLTTNVTGLLPVANGGTGTATPALVAGTNVTITGSWPNQTVNATAGGTGTVTSVDATVPSFLSVSGGPVTTSGTLAIAYSGTALPIANGGTGATSLAAAGIVTLTGTETLTNKTLTAPTMTAAVLNDGYTEEVFAVTGTTPALSPTDGSIQTWTLSGNSTPTAGTWASGQSLTLMVDDDTAYTIDWSSVAVTWKTNGGTAPTLNTTGFTAIQLWKVDTVIYGARVGDA